MFKNYPIFDIGYSEDKTELDYISLVKNPAVDIKGIAFDDDKPFMEYSFRDFQYEGIIASVAMRADYPIFRKDKDNGDHYVRFKKDVIKKYVEKFASSNKEVKINLDHETEVPSAFIFQSWIVEDSEKDMCNWKYGFKDVPVGSWFVLIKCKDKDFFQKQVIDEGKVSFSVEGLFTISPAQFSKLMEDNKIETKIEKMENKLKFAAEKLEDGTTIYVSSIEQGAEVYVIDENLDKVPVFDGEHKLTDGKTIVTVDGKITEVRAKEEMAEVVVEETPVETEVEVPEVVKDEVDVMAAITPKLDELWLALGELQNKINDLQIPEKKEEFKKVELTVGEKFAAVMKAYK
jgi:hypothetical protein